MDMVAILAGVVIALLLRAIWRAVCDARRPPPEPLKWLVGDITPATLATHNGLDWSKPVLLAVRGTVYDVSRDPEQYGPGTPLAVYGGREVARALALDSLQPGDCSGDLSGLSEQQLARLEAAEAAIRTRFDEVGKVVPMRDFSLEQLARHDGRDASLPMLISIRGTVFDVSSGKQFYGPGGIYPFAGREVARAFALISTDVADCNDDLEGLGAMEMEALRDWEAKFLSKYPVVGRLVKAGQQGGAAGEAQAAAA